MNFENVFTFEQRPDIPYDFHPERAMSLTFEINPNLRIIKREGYTILDLFSDIGGLYGIGFMFIAFLL